MQSERPESNAELYRRDWFRVGFALAALALGFVAAAHG